mmetsp:Transcript_9541/g.29494  ORF Transcript_9541/g.29494 Transcript_9541/m.29494 type:complete len:233 (-) Transcript_9541:200-898(-)
MRRVLAVRRQLAAGVVANGLVGRRAFPHVLLMVVVRGTTVALMLLTVDVAQTTGGRAIADGKRRDRRRRGRCFPQMDAASGTLVVGLVDVCGGRGAQLRDDAAMPGLFAFVPQAPEIFEPSFVSARVVSARRGRGRAVVRRAIVCGGARNRRRRVARTAHDHADRLRAGDECAACVALRRRRVGDRRRHRNRVDNHAGRVDFHTRLPRRRGGRLFGDRNAAHRYRIATDDTV